MAATPPNDTILDTLRHIQRSQTQLLTSVETLTERLNAQETKATASPQALGLADVLDYDASYAMSSSDALHPNTKDSTSIPVEAVLAPGFRSNLTSRIVLT